ncbi:hypothetical protein [Clostridium thailandense]|uniref:hypothetical protein n=1 Tax=Clostridium thailandense TaxID=2794346 RepID=UPI003988B930
MIDNNGYLADFIWGNQDDEPRVDAISSAAPVIPKPSSITKNTKNTSLDKVADTVVQNNIKSSKRYVSTGTLTLGKYIKTNRSGILIKKISSKAGLYSLYDIGKTVYENYREYPNTWKGRSAIDIVIFGAGIIVGGAIGGEALVAGVAAGVFIGIGSDLLGDAIKKHLYKD